MNSETQKKIDKIMYETNDKISSIVNEIKNIQFSKMDEKEKQIQCDKLREKFEQVMLEEEKKRVNYQIPMKKMKSILLIIWR